MVKIFGEVDKKMAKGKYDGTLNLTRTDFPMRANLPSKEPEILGFWDKVDIYKKIQEKNQGNEKFILHDGPPYANGDIHLGHTLNKVLKDIIVKQKSMQGFDSPYIPGWDTHGLPIEQQAIKSLGIDRHKIDVLDFRNRCKDYALKYVDIQRKQFIRLGVRAEWNQPYITLNPQFEAVQIKMFGAMANKGYIYKGKKPVYWCADCETALAEAEIEYNNKVSSSIYVKFPVKDGKGIIPEDAFVVIWTTTPWTLPANMGIALHPDLDYILLEAKGDKLVIAKGLLEKVQEEIGWEEHRIIKEFKGKDLERAICKHPFFERDSLLILGEHVTLEAGTGCVHTAPGHGEDDFYVAQEYGLEILSPVDNSGKFTDEAGKFKGLFVQDANKDIIAELSELNMLLKVGKIEHQYPYCWRCKQAVLYRATEQWFASIDGFRQNALDEIDKVEWIPSWGRDRIYNMIRDRGDWCISRQRTWGVPIPIIYCESCNKSIISEESIEIISNLFATHGSNIWYQKDAKEFLPEGFICECGTSEYRKETDIMDVWFDSGSSHMAVVDTHKDLTWPADMYLEGSDQHRGWFNSSLSTAVAVRCKAPYKKVLTHGFVVDEDGRKMSKSLGNVIDPIEMTNKLGADILRLWVSSADYRSDISVSQNIIKQSAEAYRKIRNTCRFILGNLYDYDPQSDKVNYEEISDLDKWALLKSDKLLRKVSKAYAEYEFHVVFHSVHNFCTIDLSNIYFDVLKDKLYCSHPNDPGRKAAQTVMHEIIHVLLAMITPILAFTSEEIWGYLRQENDSESVQLLDWPKPNDKYMAKQEMEEKMEKLLLLREVSSKALEEARSKKVIGHSLAAKLNIFAESEWLELINSSEEIDKFLIVSQVELFDIANKREESESMFTEGLRGDIPGLWISVEAAEGEKCERCWIISQSVSEDEKHPTLCRRCAEVVERITNS